MSSCVRRSHEDEADKHVEKLASHTKDDEDNKKMIKDIKDEKKKFLAEWPFPHLFR